MPFYNMDNGEIKSLLSKYNKGEATLQEVRMIEYWYAKQSLARMANPESEDYARIKADMLAFMKGNRTQIPVKRKLWMHNYRVKTGLWTAAASLLLILSIGLYFYQTKYRNEEANRTSVYTADITPGKNTATLTLANGKRIVLSDAVNGELAKEAGVVVRKVESGQLVYEVIDHESKATSKMNQLSTTNGETYQVKLPDGTFVWLNAGSSIKYPSSFAGMKKRSIELNGEAYLEVAKDKDHPFVVSTGEQEVEVLGTHFNINAYTPVVKTTLLEGSVKVSDPLSHASGMLKPGQESRLTDKGLVIGDADTEQAVAWKNGYFRFNNDDIETVMRQLTLWYDIEVRYEGNITDEKFYGKISRFKNISSVLLMLEKSKGVHFKIEGRRVTVIN